MIVPAERQHSELCTSHCTAALGLLSACVYSLTRLITIALQGARQLGLITIVPSLESDVTEASDSSDEDDCPPPLPPPRTESLKKKSSEDDDDDEDEVVEVSAGKILITDAEPYNSVYTTGDLRLLQILILMCYCFCHSKDSALRPTPKYVYFRRVQDHEASQLS